MKFNPKTEKEVNQGNLWDKGTYAFEILEASDEVSKSGKDMIKLKVRVFKDSGKSQNIFDYLLGDTMEYKLRHAADVCGLLDDYETGELSAYNFIGKTGKVKIGVSIDKTGAYPDRNNIIDYVVDVKRLATLSEAIGDDDVPF